ncbi:unnamed protein product [Ceutorhynchus assimilis]|uniref:LRRK2 beta-propeller domain-containing protein n=1 Tax=Ceutorhynchus assimilis TaxID=467358 RepID=A0A9N9QDT5_9CUCU|nr:unnamed protein product [Ceutorhynchus assimilis]
MDRSRRGGYNSSYNYNNNYSRTRDRIDRNRRWNNQGNNPSRRVSPYTYRNQYQRNHRIPSHNHPNARPPPTFVESRRCKPARPASPIEGSEEYMSLKIQQKSALIMRHLLSPNEPIVSKPDLEPIIETIVIDDTVEVVSANDTRKSSNKNKKNSVKAKDIYEKIRNYLTKLGKSKMINFINASSSSSLNTVITQMQQHERLELSRILRDMKSSSASPVEDDNNFINPDLLLNMTELPEDVIRTLERTLNIDLSFFNEGLHQSCNEVYEDALGEPDIFIKKEIICNEDFPCSPESMKKLPPNDEYIMNEFPVKEELMEDLPNEEFLEDLPVIEKSMENVSNEDFLKDLPVEEKSMENVSNEDFMKDLPVKEESMENVFNEDFMKDLPVKEKSMEDLSNEEIPIKEESVEDLPPNCEFIEHISGNEELMGDLPPYETDIPVKEESVNSVNVSVVQVPKPMTGFKIEDEDISDSFSDLKTLLAAENKDKESIDQYSIESPPLSIEETANIELNEETYNLNQSSINKVEATLKEIVEAESKRVHSNVDSILVDINLIDECCKHLNKYKNVLIRALAYKNKDCQCPEKSIQPVVIIATSDEDNGVGKKRKLGTNVHSDLQTQQSQSRTCKIQKLDQINQLKINPNQEAVECETESSAEVLKLPKVQGLVTVIELIDNQLVMGTKSGSVIFASKKDGTIQHTIDVTHQSITSIAFNSTGHNQRTLMYVGSLDMVLRIYDVKTKEKLGEDGVSDQVRCMDSKWGFVFIGCKDGNLLRYWSEKSKVDFELYSLNLEIFSLKATEEGARRVLIVGHRGAEVFVRDAMFGLFLRSFSFDKPTVYSMEFNGATGYLYCGTAHDNVLVYDFNRGNLLQVFAANDSDQPPGISCLKLFKNFLFVGCYNGFVYVFNILTGEKIATLPGPGGGIICMQLLSQQVILSTLNHEFSAVILPENISLNDKKFPIANED